MDVLQESLGRLKFTNDRIKSIENAFGIEYINSLGIEYNGYMIPSNAFKDPLHTPTSS